MQVVSTEYLYLPLEQIGVGEGLNSTVFRAHDPQLGGEVAVKQIPKSKFKHPLEFFAESRAMEAASCPNVLPIRLASTAGDHICLVMPFLKNGSLHSRIANGPLTPREVIRVSQGLLKGLSQIHAKRIVHFDVKPSNVLFSDTDEALIADFGQARHAGASGFTIAPAIYDTAMPPEVINTLQGTVQSDVYQAGVTIYRAINGNPFWRKQVESMPVDDDEFFLAITQGKLPDRDAFLPHVPQWLRMAIRKAISLDPAERYRDASEFAMALGRNKIAIDWACEINGPCEMVWRGTPRGKSPLEVRLVCAGKKRGVEVYKKGRDGTLTRFGVDVFWRPNMTPAKAFKYLRQLFQTLA